MPCSPTATGRYNPHPDVNAQRTAALPSFTTRSVADLLDIDPSDKAAKRAIGLTTQKMLLSVARMDRGKGQGDLLHDGTDPHSSE